MKFSLTSAFACTVLVVAGLADLGSAQSPRATCRCPATGTARTYNSTQLTTAVSTGAGARPSSIGKYPHTFRNFENIKFPACTGQTLNEFPVLTTGKYTGGDPKADRVIYTNTSQFCGCITHTGAPTTNGFVGCSFTV